MNAIPNPDSWLDFFAIIVVASATIIPSWFASRAHKTAKENKVEIATVRSQVVNGHTTPMRADMDDMRSVLEIIKDSVHETKVDLVELRKDLREERHCRFDLERRFGKHLDHGSSDNVTEQDWHDGTTA